MRGSSKIQGLRSNQGLRPRIAALAGIAGSLRLQDLHLLHFLHLSCISLARRLLCAIVRGYQLFISPYLPKSCRFYPSCSEYMIQAISEYGALRGIAKGCWRILRCNPFGTGGYDPVVPNAECGMPKAECGSADHAHVSLRAKRSNLVNAAGN